MTYNDCETLELALCRIEGTSEQRTISLRQAGVPNYARIVGGTFILSGRRWVIVRVF